MTNKIKLTVGGVALLVIVGTVFLWTVDIPAPTKKMSKTISNDRFKK